jgi:hypothetical protein
MKPEEAAAIVAKIGRLYPQWASSIHDDDKAATVVDWSEEIYNAGRNLDAREAWKAVHGALEHYASPFPPGIFDIVKAIKAHSTRVNMLLDQQERLAIAPPVDPDLGKKVAVVMAVIDKRISTDQAERIFEEEAWKE